MMNVAFYSNMKERHKIEHKTDSTNCLIFKEYKL